MNNSEETLLDLLLDMRQKNRNMQRIVDNQKNHDKRAAVVMAELRTLREYRNELEGKLEEQDQMERKLTAEVKLLRETTARIGPPMPELTLTHDALPPRDKDGNYMINGAPFGVHQAVNFWYREALFHKEQCNFMKKKIETLSSTHVEPVEEGEGKQNG